MAHAPLRLPVAILGGTFDPVHFGHLRTALEVKQELGIQQVRLLPCAIPPHRGIPSASPGQRLEMLRLAIADESALSIDERELQRPGPSYMVDTLQSLRQELGETPLCLIMGADAFVGLNQWYHWQEIPELAHIVVVHRPGWQLEQIEQEAMRGMVQQRLVREPAALAASSAGKILFHPVTPLAISATAIRETIRAGKSAAYLLPQAVWHYIRQQQLYR